DFGREPTARAAERLLVLIPPFTPAACWCARTIVESMACSSSAGGPRLARVSNAASHTPSLLQRVNRTKTEFQLPYRSGMSRHGAPVRRTPRMPLTLRRLLSIAGPRSPRSGSSGSKMCHHQLRQHIQTFLDAYNLAKRLKTLNGLTGPDGALPHGAARELQRRSGSSQA